MQITSAIQKNDKTRNEKYISRCIELGKNGLGSTFPNPSVGCVIVHHEKIIGEGFTSPYGGAHAEVNAIASVPNKALLKEATIYVTLEPCSHHGKTPPCADLIIKHAIPHVVIGILDPHEKVAGKGIQKLKNVGCNVTVGVLEKECREHHKRFLTYHQKKRPYIILKWAETLDGFMAPEEHRRSEKPTPYWITNERSRQLVHQWRSVEQAILVGTQTVIKDNPKLNVRAWHGTSQVRIVLDRTLKIGPDHFVLDKNEKTIVLTEVTDTKNYVRGIMYELIDFSDNVIQQICDILYKHHMVSLIVEGGAKTLETFLAMDVWDEARVFIGDTNFESGLKAPSLPTDKLVDSKHINNDILNFYIND
ncbi:MAG: bifunctional diaminohydroxyphosphoribosylaminopyrimidine deaminase/5-amino-6-(5-phosphoribosylamino)uracil reductase RibD [Bacteroidota bacterium]